MPGTFVYNATDNDVDITGGTTSSSADLPSYVAADRAGTYTLLAATNGADNLTLTKQIRPVELRALQIDLIVASKTTEADYIHLTGTGFRDNSQTETIDVSAGNGTYTTAKYWRTITDVDCNDNAGGGGTVWADGTLSVVQNQWGVIWDFGNGMYQVDVSTYIGDGSTATFFRLSGGQHLYAGRFRAEANATLELGQYDGTNGHTYNGASANIHSSSSSGNAPAFEGTLNVYGSWLHLRGAYLGRSSASINARDATISSDAGLRNQATHTFNRVNFILGANNSEFRFEGTAGTTPTDIKMHRGYFLLVTASTINDLDFGYNTNAYDFTISASSKVVDPKTMPATPSISGGTGLAFTEEYTCNIHVADSGGSDLESVTVLCQRANLIEGTDGNIYKCTVAHTSDTDKKPVTGADWADYWELANEQTWTGGTWVSGASYESSAQDFSVSTDANGDIAEQQMIFKSWQDANEDLYTWVRTFTLSKTGYVTLVQENVILSQAINWWHLELQDFSGRSSYDAVNPIGYKGAVW
jgi:hypothetical protein